MLNLIKDYKMMKAFKIFSMAAVVFMMVACSSEDEALDNTPVAGRKVHFTATIAAPNSDASTRTTYTEIKSGTDAGKIKVAWEQGDKIALIHNGKKDEVTVQTLNADGSANISGDITVGTDGEAVTIVYPAASVDAPTSGADPVDNATYAAKWNSQDGTLTYIQDYLDFCRATSTLKVSGTKATLSDNISMVSTIAIFKFTTKNSNGTATIDVRPLIINIGSQNFVITPASATSELYVALPAVSSQTVNFLATSSDGETKYSCSKAGVSFTARNYYQSILKMNLGLLPGKFTINASGDKVYFSQGNLQATTTDLGQNWTCAFATNQWDYIGGTDAPDDASATTNNKINGNGTVSENGTVDLFGWVGASSTWTGMAQYGITNSNNVMEAGNGYGNGYYENLKSDWGTLAISNGGNKTNSGWRTLTKDEWAYLFTTRTTGGTVFAGTTFITPQARYVHAEINKEGSADGVKGIILFPDGVDITSSEVTTPGTVNSVSAYAIKCTSAQWIALEAKGCVFLPAAGNRGNPGGASVGRAGTGGVYWSSSHGSGAAGAYSVYFISDSLNSAGYYYRNHGFSVRLVRNAE